MANKRFINISYSPILPRQYFFFVILCCLPLPPLWADQTSVAATSSRKKQLRLAPTEHLYSPYLADQKRVTFGLQALYVSTSDIPDTGHPRFALRMGGRLELFQWYNNTDPQQALQANFEVGFRGHFDASFSQDNIGWDGNYGLLFTYRDNPVIAWRFGSYHTSSHIGDEYIQRTGRKRIEYTREEVLSGMQINLDRQWQYYLEAAYGFYIHDGNSQKPKRLQTGIQFQQTDFSAQQRLGWYAGLDLSSYEERDWDINKALQVGFAFAAQPHTWRVAMDFYDGQSVLGEFFQHNERYVGIGLYLDI